jgi:hypothetical protein
VAPIRDWAHHMDEQLSHRVTAILPRSGRAGTRHASDDRAAGYVLATFGSRQTQLPGAVTKTARKKWRRRPDLNRGWRFCRPYRVVGSDAWLRLLVPDDAWFYLMFGRCCSEVAPKCSSGRTDSDLAVVQHSVRRQIPFHIQSNAASAWDLARSRSGPVVVHVARVWPVPLVAPSGSPRRRRLSPKPDPDWRLGSRQVVQRWAIHRTPTQP